MQVQENPRATLIDRLHLAVPDELRPLKNWLLWRKRERPGQPKFDKIPVYASGINRHGEQGSTADRTELVDFNSAVQALRRGGFDGLGLAMLGDGYTGLDFDDCIDATGTIKPEVQALIEGTYAEKSPSGKGIRAFYRGALDPALADRKQHEAGIETFCSKGFLTITGSRINSADIAPLPQGVTTKLTVMLGQDTRGQDRHARLAQVKNDDPVLARLIDHNMVIKDCGSGKFDVHCPFEAEHTTPSGAGATVYFLPHTNGYANGKLHCLHAHCMERPPGDFIAALGLENERAGRATANGTAPAEATLPDDQAGDSTAAEISNLAKLTPIQYDRCREAKAKELGVRVATLDKEVSRLRGDDTDDEKSGTAMVFDEPEPWPESVDGAQLLDDLSKLFKRYVILPVGAQIILALWVMHTWLHNAARISPILAINSPEKRCGKTTLLSLLKRLVKRALAASNITSPSLFRATELWRPTLLIDEADSFLKDSEELRGVLNSGHTRDAAFIIRTAGDDHEPRCFSTWAPKAIALIGNLPATLADRSIVISMRRKRAGEKAERLNLSACFDDLVRRAARWAMDNESRVASIDQTTPTGLNDRAADNWRELLAIAEVAGGEWPKLCDDYLATLRDNDDGDEHAGVQLLADIRQMFKERNKDVLFSIHLAEHLATLAERPWPEWRHGKPITQRQLARLLRPFDIQTETIRDGEKRLKGYAIASFDDAFSRYLPNSSVTAVTMNKNKDLDEFRSVTDHKLVTDRIVDKPLISNVCHGVTDENNQETEVMRTQSENEDRDEAELWETDRPAFERLQAEKYQRACRNRAEKMAPLASLKPQDADENGLVPF